MDPGLQRTTSQGRAASGERRAVQIELLNAAALRDPDIDAPFAMMSVLASEQANRVRKKAGLVRARLKVLAT
jgi:hypothetical protein